MTIATLLAETNQSETVLIVTLIAGHVFTLTGLMIKAWIDHANRVEDRLLNESKAKLIREEVAASARLAAEKGKEREERLTAKIDENTAKTEFGIAKAEMAYEAANGHNEKIKVAVESVAEVAKAIAQTPAPTPTQQIHVVHEHELQEVHHIVDTAP